MTKLTGHTDPVNLGLVSVEGVRVFRRWCCSATTAVLLHGVVGGYLIAQTRSVAIASRTPEPMLVWLDGAGSSTSEATEQALALAPRGRAAAAGTSSRPGAPSRAAVATRRAPRAPAPPSAHGATSPAGSGLPPSSTPPTPPSHEGPVDIEGSRARLDGSAGGVGSISAGAPGLGEGGGRDAQPHAFEELGPGSPARLLGSGSPCGDLFPHSARNDAGTVDVTLALAKSGEPLGSEIVAEAPRGQGFALAASHCVRRLRFAPALDGSGHAVASRSVVRLHFARRGESTRAAL